MRTSEPTGRFAQRLNYSDASPRIQQAARRTTSGDLRSSNFLANASPELLRILGLDEEGEEIMEPSSRAGGDRASGSAPKSMASLEAMQIFNPHNRMIEALLQIASTRRNEAGMR